MKYDLTITVSVILALCALLSPIITAIINNCHLKKIKKMELQQENFKIINLHKREFFDKYLKLIGTLSYEYGKIDLAEFASAYYQILPYIPKEKAVYFREFSDEITKLDFNISNPSFSSLLHDQIIPTIKKEIEKL